MRTTRATAHPASFRDVAPLFGMAAMYFLVVCAIGILRPIKNALALDGLGATDFYKVYLVSALVVLFVPLYTRLADRLPWRVIVPSVGAFFALNLLVFRVVYVPGSGTFGLLFYGWYDLFTAALVTQFFIATQLYLNTRTAKSAYPWIIAAGSIGATAGGAATGLLAERMGTPNLLLLAAALIGVFCLGIPFTIPDVERLRTAGRSAERSTLPLSIGGLRSVAANRQVQLIAGTVLVTILVKQLVDYQFNVVTKEVFLDRDAISAFQGKFNALTQWLPIVALAALRPALRRWGVGFAVLLLPLFMLGASVALAVFWGLWAATFAKAADGALRYSAERTAREILYVPVPEEIKLKAKTYIDVAVEKGFGKAASAVLLLALLQVMPYRGLPYATAALAVLSLAMALAVRREYVRTLARSIQGRFASFRGGFASMLDASTFPAVREALRSDLSVQTLFALDLVEQSGSRDTRLLAPEMDALVDHRSAEVRARAIEWLARHPDSADRERLRTRLFDDSPEVREATIRALVGGHGPERAERLREFLAHDDPRVRIAAWSCLTPEDLGDDGDLALGREFADLRWKERQESAGARLEVAIAVGVPGLAEDPSTYLDVLLEDPDSEVRVAALRSAARLGYAPGYPHMVRALASPDSRGAAREALAAQGTAVVPLLSDALHDPSVDPVIRRNIPAALARIPAPETVHALIRAILAPETDQLLDHRAVKALNRLRVTDPTLGFPAADVLRIACRELESASRYASALDAVHRTRAAAMEASGEGALASGRLAGIDSGREVAGGCPGPERPEVADLSAPLPWERSDPADSTPLPASQVTRAMSGGTSERRSVLVPSLFRTRVAEPGPARPGADPSVEDSPLRLEAGNGSSTGVLLPRETGEAAGPGALPAVDSDRAIEELLLSALEDGITERREAVFRCLGLLHHPEGVYRAYLTVSGGSPAARANALEWLERQLGHGTFDRFAPLLDPDFHLPASTAGPEHSLVGLLQDNDTWIATCAAVFLARSDSPAAGSSQLDSLMHLIEKVLLLQRVDLLSDSRGAHLALLASIAEEIQLEPGTPIVRLGEPPEALYLIRRGSVQLDGPGERLTLEAGTAFGTWALIDDAPSPYQATVVQPTQLLRVGRGDFQDLLSDHPELGLGLLQGLAHRFRSLVA